MPTGLPFLLISLDVGFVLGLGAGLAAMTICSTVPADQQTDSATLVVIYMPLSSGTKCMIGINSLGKNDFNLCQGVIL